MSQAYSTPTSTSTVSDQWLRKWSVVVYDSAAGANVATQISAGSDAPGEEQLHIVFEVHQTTASIPNYCSIKIYNVSNNLVTMIKNQYRRVTLSAGYLNGRFGVIFDGTIRQIKFGGETAVDSFLEIDAADGDRPYNNATISSTLIGSANTPQGRIKALAQSLTPWDTTVPSSQVLAAPVLPIQPRPTVQYGLSAPILDNTAKSVYVGGQPMEWSIQNGQFVLVPSNVSISDTTAFIINSLTGMVGFPVTTSDGLEVRTLLNPSYGIRRPVIINNTIVNQTLAAQGNSIQGIQEPIFPGPGISDYIMDVSADGTYIILVVEHRGDSRGNDWYSDLVVISAVPVGGSTNPKNYQQVQPYSGINGGGS
jgi:hypothetical protein